MVSASGQSLSGASLGHTLKTLNMPPLFLSHTHIHITPLSLDPSLSWLQFDLTYWLANKLAEQFPALLQNLADGLPFYDRVQVQVRSREEGEQE